MAFKSKGKKAEIELEQNESKGEPHNGNVVNTRHGVVIKNPQGLKAKCDAEKVTTKNN